jgi:hypothetical protein
MKLFIDRVGIFSAVIERRAHMSRTWKDSNRVQGEHRVRVRGVQRSPADFQKLARALGDVATTASVEDAEAIEKISQKRQIKVDRAKRRRQEQDV